METNITEGNHTPLYAPTHGAGHGQGQPTDWNSSPIKSKTPDSKPTTQTADNQSTSSNTQAHRIFYREDGLSNNFVQSIIEDRNNYIWVTTSNGISRIHINPENQEIGFTNFNQLDGALEEEYIQGAIFESSDGTLYFGGIDGFTIFRPDHESATPGLPYKPVFTQLTSLR